MNTPIHDFLCAYSASGAVRCHMPGGKDILNKFDITEISGADSLYESSGIIRESERNAASLLGTGETLYSCGGSTLCIQTMLALAKAISGKTTIAAGRYSHKSLVNTCALLGMDINWIYPDEYLGTDISASEVEKTIDDDTAAVFVNSVDYYGGTSDISAISRVCKRKGVLLLADNAHGAYRVFTGDHPILLGADMTADSAHKTLPTLTGAAYLRLRNPDWLAAAKEYMSVFGSSSPSYLIMDSLDLCNRFIAEEKSTAESAFCSVKRLKESLMSLGYTLRESDAMRITIDASAYGYSGYDFAEELRKRGAECEMSDEKYVVLLFSVSQREEDFSRLYGIFSDIPGKPPIFAVPHKLLRPEKVMTVREAMFSPRVTVKTEEAEGLVCGGVVSPCPPCVPLVVPGERIDRDCIDELLRYGAFYLPCIRY